MKEMIIKGTDKVSGKITISGAKNSAVALIPAAMLSDSLVKLDNVPNLSDCDALEEIIQSLGCGLLKLNGTYIIDNSTMENKLIPNELSRRLRASYYFMGSLLSKYHHVEIGFPGGCDFGTRPIDMHLKGFEKMGATITTLEDRVIIDAPNLHGAEIELEKVSVGATINLLMASVKAEGITTIKNAAKEPEIINVIDLLNSMGAKIQGKGTNTLIIEGVKHLGTGTATIIPDRIETGTFMILGALKGDNLVLENTSPENVQSTIDILKNIGANIEVDNNKIIINKAKKLKNVVVETNPHPDFPTDLGQLMAVLMTQIEGESKIIENIYAGRTKYLKEIEKMGAKYKLEDNEITIYGPVKLKGERVYATDLRAGAALVLAGAFTSVEDTTVIDNAKLILRGYENIVKKLNDIGIKASIEEVPEINQLKDNQNTTKILQKTLAGA